VCACVGESYYMPNWMCLMRAGILSTTCCLTA
jgi:hypothetical protein